MRPKPTRKDIRESIQSKPTTNDIRKITPPKENNNPAQPREDSYAKAHDYITGFNSWRSGKPILSNSYLYEENFTIKMSTKEWIKLSDELKLSESDDQYPRCAFNSVTSTLIIQCMPTAVHETVQISFTKAITIAEADLPFPAQSTCVTGEKMNGFESQYFGSGKIADLAVQITNAKGVYETKMAVETGFSEDYEHLTNSAKLWLEGMSSVFLCLLVSFEEVPRYRCPVDHNMNEEKFKKLGFPNPWELKPEHFHLKGPFGPVIYKGLDDEELGDEGPDNEELGDEESDDEEPDNEELKWVGNISAALLERWRRDQTGKAKKSGRSVDILTTRNIKFKRSDFMNTTPEHDRTILIDCERFRQSLTMKMKALAADRCREMLRARMGREHDLRDGDYTPP